MKKYLPLLIIVLIVTGIYYAIIQQPRGPIAQKPKVATTIYPLYDVAKTIAGNETDVVLLLPAGVSEHLYEPKSTTIKKAQGADIIFAIGQELDNWVDAIMPQIDSAQKITVDLRIPLKEYTHHDDHEEDHNATHHEEETGAYDPHYWLDPNNMIIIIDTMSNYIAGNDPDNATLYSERASALKQRIQEQDAIWTEQLATLEDKNIITFHNAFAYFADHFNINVVATVEPFAGKEPTAQYLQELQSIIEEHNVTRVYREPQLSSSVLTRFADDYNITIGVLDPLGGSKETETYIDLINYNVEAILQKK